jgi:hypothetical protein
MSFVITLIIIALFIHFVADFIFQTDWMATNKSKSNVSLMAHVITYTLVTGVGMFLAQVILPNFFDVVFQPTFAAFFATLNGVIHFFVDYVTSRINSKLWDAKQVRNFFVGVGADQFIHATTLILSLYWLIN